MRNSRTTIRVLCSRFTVAIALAAATMGCQVDEDAVDGGLPPGTGTGTGGLDESGTGDSGSEEGGTAGSGGGGGCSTDFPSGAPYDAIRESSGGVVQSLETPSDWTEACPDTTSALGAMTTGSPNLYVYRPGDMSTMDGWPDADLALVLFMHGQGGSIVDSGEHTNPFLDDLAAEGFVVVAGTGGQAVEQRERVLRCAAEWALTVWEESERLSQCSVAAVGHSQGGGAAHNLALVDDEFLEGLQAVVGIAPASRVQALMGFDPVTDPVSADRSVPYLVIQGPEDEDTTDNGITNYDRMVPEDTEPVAASDKVMLLPYDAMHWVFGGRPYDETTQLNGYTQTAVDRGRAIASTYIPLFLRWKIYGDESLRRWFVDPSHYEADVSAFPDAIGGAAVLEDFWSDLYEDSRYDVLGARPVILSMFSQGSENGAGRLRIDTLFRDDAPATCSDPDHLDALPPAELLGGLGESDICLGMSTRRQCCPRNPPFAARLGTGSGRRRRAMAVRSGRCEL